jgi:hypothetical protein
LQIQIQLLDIENLKDLKINSSWCPWQYKRLSFEKIKFYTDEKKEVLLTMEKVLCVRNNENIFLFLAQKYLVKSSLKHL